MTDSFESVMEEMREKVASPYWKDMADRLQKAHEREMEAVRDPQRIGGTLERGSFEYAIEQLREFRWQHATNDDDAIPYINGVAKAHDHEMEHLRKSRFREGYEAGQRSMDAEHYQLKLKLQGLRFDGGSHENLSKLAYAIYPCATGWTCESCEGLRDELVRLMGGVSEPPTYDVLDNERQKAVCELSGISVDELGKKYNYVDVYPKFIWAVGQAIGLRHGAGFVDIVSRLIHLLGGVDGTCPNADRICPNAVQHASITDDGSDHEPAQGGESGNPDCAFGDCDCGESGQVDKQDSQKAPILANSDGENGNKVTITDELRKFKGHINAGLTPEMVLALRAEINCIADRIDERARLGAIKADIWQDYANQMRGERDNLLDLLRDARDEYKMLYQASAETSVNFHAMRDRVWGLEAERDELREKLDEADAAIANWREREKSFAESERLREEMQKRLDEMRKQREHWASEATKMYRLFFSHDEYCVPDRPSEMVADAVGTLQAKLDAATHDDGAYKSKVELLCELILKNDRIEKLQAKLDAYDQTHVELPKDENGEHIHAYDMVEDVEEDAYFDGSRFVTQLKLYADGEWNVGAKEEIGDRVEWFEPCDLRHAKQASAETAESIVRDLTLGTITEREAVRRIQRIADGTAEALNGRR